MTDYSKQLHQEMTTFQHRYGENLYKIYTSLIDYLAGYLDWTGHPVTGWSYSAEQNESFRKMSQIALSAIADGQDANGWYDLFGDIFMLHLADKDRRGQCFTPQGIANLCAKISFNNAEIESAKMPCGFFGTRYILSDPACGSGRLMLAGSYHFVKTYDNYPFAVCEDIDTICVKQTAINLALHGFYGEVVCHDSLREPDNLRFGYIVNEGMYPIRDGLSSLRYSEDPKHFICTRHWSQMKGTPNQADEKKKPIQLTLFDL